MQEMEETWVPSLSWEDSLEEGMATHSCILAWTIPWTEGPGGLQPMGRNTILLSLLVRNETLFLHYTLHLGCGLQKIITDFEM